MKTTTRVDDDGYLIDQVIAWKPTLKVICRGIGYGLLATFAAWVSPLFIVTLFLQELYSDQTAWTFAVIVGVLTTSFYFFFMAGRRQIVSLKDGHRSAEPIYSNKLSDPNLREFWAEYHQAYGQMRDAMRKYGQLTDEMKQAGLDPITAPPSFLVNPYDPRKVPK